MAGQPCRAPWHRHQRDRQGRATRAAGARCPGPQAFHPIGLKGLTQANVVVTRKGHGWLRHGWRKGAQPANAQGGKPKAQAASAGKAAPGKKPRRSDDHEIGGRPNVPGPEAFEKKIPAGKGAAGKGGAGKGAPSKGGKPAPGKPRAGQGGRQKKGR